MTKFTEKTRQFRTWAMFYSCLICSLSPLSFVMGSPAISGIIQLDDTWERVIYLSMIPSFSDMSTASDDFILGLSPVSGEGEFTIDLSDLPDEDRLYRLHVCKEGDPVATIFIGGREENHFHFSANRHSALTILTEGQLFDGARVIGNSSNQTLYSIQQLLDRKWSKNDVYSTARRENDRQLLIDGLFEVAHSAADVVSAMMALYYLEGEAAFSQEPEKFYSVLEKWEDSSNMPYYKEVAERLAFLSYRESRLKWPQQLIIPLLIGLVALFGFSIIIWKTRSQSKNSKSASTLSVQEKRVLELLSKGLSNKEISAELNIGMSTVKSHVHRIYGKLGVSSRKQVFRWTDSHAL